MQAETWARVSLSQIIGRRAVTTVRFLWLAVGLFALTVIISSVGQLLLSNWNVLYAHLILESVAALLLLGTIGAAIASAYVNDGFIISVILTLAPVFGFCLFIALDELATGDQLAVNTFLSLMASASVVGVGAYLCGSILRVVIHENDEFKLNGTN
jgi:energy-converting hydrogenase Eha subunit E